jgi:hypothetical protein
MILMCLNFSHRHSICSCVRASHALRMRGRPRRGLPVVLAAWDHSPVATDANAEIAQREAHTDGLLSHCERFMTMSHDLSTAEDDDDARPRQIAVEVWSIAAPLQGRAPRRVERRGRVNSVVQHLWLQCDGTATAAAAAAAALVELTADLSVVARLFGTSARGAGESGDIRAARTDAPSSRVLDRSQGILARFSDDSARAEISR